MEKMLNVEAVTKISLNFSQGNSLLISLENIKMLKYVNKMYK